MCAGFEGSILAAGKIPDGDGSQHRGQPGEEADVAEYFHKGQKPDLVLRLSNEIRLGFLPDSQADIDLETSLGLARRAFEIKKRFQIRYWDAAVTAAARVLDCPRFSPRISTTGRTMMVLAS